MDSATHSYRTDDVLLFSFPVLLFLYFCFFFPFLFPYFSGCLLFSSFFIHFSFTCSSLFFLYHSFNHDFFKFFQQQFFHSELKPHILFDKWICRLFGKDTKEAGISQKENCLLLWVITRSEMSNLPISKCSGYIKGQNMSKHC